MYNNKPIKSKPEDFILVNPNDKFDSKEFDILEKNKRFYSHDKKYVDTMIQIISGESNISIRVLDWFVSNYSKKNNTCYKITINGKPDFFYVHNEYKNQLNGYSKHYFDPFCRKKKIIYCYRDKNGNDNGDTDADVNFITSIGQLNFFQWAIKNKIITYVERHIKDIDSDMKLTTKLNKKRKKELSILKEQEEVDVMSESSDHSELDRTICSSDNINCLLISPSVKSTTKSDSERKNKRQQLSKSAFEYGIKKSNVPIRLDFD